MQLRGKTLLIIGLTLVSLIIILYTSSRLILLDGFVSLEHQSVTQNVQRLVNTVNDQLATLRSLTADWGHWDDTYLFMQGENATFIEDNLMVETYTNLGLNLMAFIDTSAEMVYSRAVSLETLEEVAIPADLTTHLKADSPLLQHTDDQQSSVTGIIMLDDGPMLIASRPILTSQKEGPAQGTLVMGRFLDATAVQALSDQLAISLALYRIADPDLPADFRAATTALADTPNFIQALDDTTVAGYAAVTDLTGDPALIWRVDMPRGILAQGEASLQYFLGSMLVVGLVFTILMLILLDKFVLARISSLNEVVNSIRRETDFSKRVTMPGKDELANFAGAINEMLDALAKAQDDLKQALKFKSQVLANVSHDARTPISVITLRAEMLESGMFGEITEQQNDMLHSILSSSHQLLHFVNNLLDASQLEAGKLTLRNRDFYSATLLGDVETSLKPLAKKKGLKLSIVGDQVLPEHMNGDQDRLTQIIYNLVGNAVKFTNEGEVKIEISRPHEHQWAIQVSDTGPGIPKEAQERLFEAFYQVDGSTTRQQTEGVGLGLSIVKELVNLMEGQVTVTSELGVGSTFTVILPLRETEQGVTNNGLILRADR